ncbi:MAG TPA: TetR/AcrR family transcriptional regulator [Ktedonobacterales bacterium]|nr:TetR/AcrR family transcriptional regulator [Ktedonobacterales bacterium]
MPEESEHTPTAAPSSRNGRATRTESLSLAPVTARGEATKRRILDAAEDVFGELGFYEASVSEITRRAGVAQGTFYIYYHTKRDIFVELVEDMGKRLRAAMREASEGAPSRVEAERRGFAAFFQFVAAHRRIYRIVQEAERVAPEAAHDYYRRISAGYERALTSAMDAGDIRRLEPEAVAYSLMGIGHFLALRWLIWSDEEGGQAIPEMPAAIFASMMEFITHGLVRNE